MGFYGGGGGGGSVITPPADGPTSFVVNDMAGNPRVMLGTLPAFPTYGAIWLGGAAPTNSNYNLAATTGGDLAVNAPAARRVQLTINDNVKWQVEVNGTLTAPTDNTQDIGASNSGRPRSGYFGTDLTVNLGTKIIQERIYHSAGVADFYVGSAGAGNRLNLSGTSIVAEAPITLPAGLNTAPSLKFVGNTTDGFYAPGASRIAIGTTAAPGAHDAYTFWNDGTFVISGSAATMTVGGGTTTGVTDLLINPTTKASGNLIDARINSISLFKVDISGNVIVAGMVRTGTGANGGFSFSGLGYFSGVGDGIFTIWNNAQTDFNRLQFGGTTSAFPALKRSGTDLHVKLADDSATTSLNALALRSGDGTTVFVDIFGPGNYLRMAKDIVVGWNSVANSGGADTGLGRVAPGVLEINNGTAGQSGALLLRARTVAQLPATPVLGMFAVVSDGAASLAWGATVTAGSTSKYLVWYNGAAWTVVGK